MYFILSSKHLILVQSNTSTHAQGYLLCTDIHIPSIHSNCRTSFYRDLKRKYTLSVFYRNTILLCIPLLKRNYFRGSVLNSTDVPTTYDHYKHYFNGTVLNANALSCPEHFKFAITVYCSVDSSILSLRSS